MTRHTESNIMDSTKRLAYIIIRSTNVHKWWEICHFTYTWLEYVDSANKICSTSRPCKYFYLRFYLRNKCLFLSKYFFLNLFSFQGMYECQVSNFLWSIFFFNRLKENVYLHCVDQSITATLTQIAFHFLDKSIIFQFIIQFPLICSTLEVPLLMC